MNYNDLTVKSIAQYCAEKSGFKINKADLESQIQHLINIEKAKQLTLTDVNQHRELLNQYNDFINTQYSYNELSENDTIDFFEWFNCG